MLLEVPSLNILGWESELCSPRVHIVTGVEHVCSPYYRATYRYTPILALLLVPNEFIHPSFGKYLFASCDIFAGIIIHNLLLKLILPWAGPYRHGDTEVPSAVKGAAPQLKQRAAKATLLTAIHFFNPMVFAISTRGSSESVLSLLVLFTLHLCLEERWDLAAIFIGLGTHWKIYPFIYGVPCLCIIGSGDPRNHYSFSDNLRRLINVRTMRFAALSAGTFALLGAFMYAMYVFVRVFLRFVANQKHRWGYPFIHESYLYHLHRRDHRHNFSPYFYLTYLTYPFKDGSNKPPLPTAFEAIVRSPLISFVPQMGLSVLAGFLFPRRKQDLPFTWFVQTFVFVLFNKVCTSQVSVLKVEHHTLRKPDICAVFLMVPPLPSSCHPSAIGLLWENSLLGWSVGRHTSPLAK